MNLDFGILWIEDSYSPEEEQNLRRRVRETGFIAKITAIPNGTDIDELARQHNLYHRYDLILLDYRLKNENGDDLAPKVRALFPSIAILFYSGSVEEPDLRRLIADKDVEGVYCSARRRFIDRTGALIDQTARSLDRLSGMRGLSMRVVAECDALMKAAMISMSRRDPKCADKISELDKDVFEFIDAMQTAYKESIERDLDSRIATRAVDSAKLWKHFRRLTKVATSDPGTFGLTEDQVERLRELRRESSQYDRVVLGKRNTLGHVVEVEGPDGWVLQGSSDIKVADFPDIRREFAAHIDALREMSELVLILDQ
ncbi:response regulator [Agrobacterium cavarae]|uniref:response regulator n=1 Tax=Agrobacterium cavarae TaxID=2528239 RepID=UPI003FD3F087